MARGAGEVLWGWRVGGGCGWRALRAGGATTHDLRGVRPQVTAEPLPRIVRLLPGRFGRDPKAPGARENSAAALLLAFTLAAILSANSPWAETYWALLDTHVGFTFGDQTFELTVKHLINDGLMAFFFFLVGLEVTSDVTIGQLTDRARAAVPVVAAIAGLALPGVIFLLFNASGENAQASRV